MTGVPPPTNQQPPAQTGQPPAAQGLPPTGLQQQMASLNQYYSNVGAAGSDVQGMGGLGFSVRQRGFGTAQAQEGQGALAGDTGEIGSSSLDQMARNLAQRWGMPIGKGRLVDEQGNFLMSPQQIADASGGRVTLGEASAQMNYISQALSRRQNEEQQQKGIATMQAGLGLVQSRGRGSMAAMMSGYYEGIADLYANQEYEAADFSYYIQKEKMDIETELQRRAEKLAKKQARGQFIAGIGVTIASLYTGNVAGVVAGGSMVAGSAGGTGWF